MLSGAMLNLDDPRVQEMLVKATDWQLVKSDSDDVKTGGQPDNPKSSADSGGRMKPSLPPLGRNPPPRRNPVRPSLPRKKGPGKGKTWRDVTAGDAAKYAVSAYEMAKSIIRYINVEEKQFAVDGTGSTTTITSTPSVINLSNVAQGSNYPDRTGDSIKPLWLDFRFYATGNSAVSGNMLRLLVVQDRENQGVDPALGDVLAGLSDPMLAPPHPLYKQRFKYLVDRNLSFNNPVGLAASGTSTTFLAEKKDPEIYRIRLSGHIFYDATAGADASNLEGAIFLMAVSQDATNGPGIRYSSQLTFTDN